MNTTFSIKEALLFGWRTFKQHVWRLVSVSAFLLLVMIVVATALDHPAISPHFWRSVAIGIPVAFIQWWFELGLRHVSFLVHDDQVEQVSALTLIEITDDRLAHYIIGTILYQLRVIVGLLLFIVPGVIWAVQYQFFGYFILDKDMKALAALDASKRLTRGYIWQLTLFGFAILLINLLGIVLLGIGFLVSIPVTIVAQVWVYRWLLEQPVR